MASKSERLDVYERVTNQIVEAIEAGAEKWEMPWHSPEASFQYPTNVLTGKQYRGVNVLALWASSYVSGYPDALWGTFKQWAELGHSVRKGEKSSIGVFWKTLEANEQSEGDSEGEATTCGTRWIARAFPLFNAAQIEGYEAPVRPETPHAERIERAEQFFQSLGADIRHGGGRAFYQPSGDLIQMPPFEVFRDPISYYSTLGHESTHWTAHPSRLDRDLKGRFGSEAYAAEELIAELGAAFLAADLELAPDPRPENAAYIQSWLKVLKEDKRAIFTASSHAQRAVDFLHDLQKPSPALMPTAQGLTL
ncbi:zincin-like metallopeptidase domain-containing protein [Microcoleus sp. B7-D4]|uniref:zincin-like metallopeptidase domain-containing protein n=1 Tax=Microcoleus sp. B7-D4 TaxID=2818696 RepID=UPI002FCF2BBA